MRDFGWRGGKVRISVRLGARVQVFFLELSGMLFLARIGATCAMNVLGRWSCVDGIINDVDNLALGATCGNWKVQSQSY